MMTLISFLALSILAGVYVISNVWISAWMLRSFFRPWRRIFRSIFHQLVSLSAGRIWVTILLHIAAAAALAVALRTPLRVLTLVATLGGYVFFVSALTLSLLASLPFVRSLWSDVFFRAAVLVSPVAMLYMAKGYAALWVGEKFGIAAANLPMTHGLATCFLLFLSVAVLLSGAAMLFEIVSFIVLEFGPRARPKTHVRTTFMLLTSTRLIRRKKDRECLRGVAQRLGLFLLALISFLACYLGFHVGTFLLGSRLSTAALSIVAFDFDAGPATQCELDEAEKLLAKRSDPSLKAVFLSSNQEKALLFRRERGLSNSIVFRHIESEPDGLRELTPVRVVNCFKTN